MILDALVIILLVFSAWKGKKIGLFRTVARFLSFVLAMLGTTLWGDAVLSWFQKTPLYAETLTRVIAFVDSTLEKGETAILKPFLFGEAGAAFSRSAAENILHTFLSVLCFLAFLLLVRILIVVIDKLVFHLPLVRPLNRGLGMVLSFVFTAVMLYLVVGALGSMTAIWESGFLSEQMKASILVRHMYENNFVLNLILRKG